MTTDEMHTPQIPDERCRFEAGLAAAGRIADLLAGEGISLGGRDVAVADGGADGLGPGLLRAGAGTVSLYDDRAADRDELDRLARWYGGMEALPEALQVAAIGAGEQLPAPSAAFDLVVWWGDPGHRHDVVSFLLELRRILRPQAHLLLRCPASGSVPADQLQHSLLAARLQPILLDADATVVRPDLEGQATPLSALVTRGARLLAYRPR